MIFLFSETNFEPMDNSFEAVISQEQEDRETRATVAREQDLREIAKKGLFILFCFVLII